MDERLFEGLTEEQKEAVRNCKTPEEIMELAANEGLEMNEAQMEAVSGGACGAIYRIDNETIVKVYNDTMPKEKIEEGSGLARYALLRGVPTAIAFDRVRVNGCDEDLHLVHGDLHMKNLLYVKGEPMVIDMDTLCAGNFVFELGRLATFYKLVPEIDDEFESGGSLLNEVVGCVSTKQKYDLLVM